MNGSISYGDQSSILDQAVNMFIPAVKLDVLTLAHMENNSLLEQASSGCSRN